ncbi:MAG: hypothetical protein K8T91_22930 [Planctomycetes bacterium]|nr:hypothetical protein [Planctomycetota bacterium]
MPSFDPEPLREVYVAYSDYRRCEELAQENHRKVVEWRWATGDMFEGRPFEKERFAHKARWLKDGQPLKPLNVQHGLDADGKILIIRNPWFSGEYNEERTTETQWIYEEGRIIYITIPPLSRPEDRKADFVRRFVYERNRLASVETFSHGHGAVESFFWENSRLEKSVSCSWQHDTYFPSNSKYSQWKGPASVSYVQLTYEYEDQGRLQNIWQQYLNADGTPLDAPPKKLTYRRPAKGESIPALSAEIEAMLFDQIPRILTEAKIEARVCCLLICYCGEDFEAGWPPFLVLGSEKERQKIIAAGSDVQYYLWAPDEMRSSSDNFFVDLQDQNLIDKCSLHSQLMSMKSSYSAGRKVLQNVARRLNEFQWDGILTTTEDFVVAFVDNTGEYPIDKDIMASISEERLANLKSRQLL